MSRNLSPARGRRVRLALAALALSAGATSLAWAQSVQVGIAAAIVGTVNISNAAAPKERKIARKQRVAWGDTIRTAKKSQLQILLLDRSNFTIGANTRMRIDRMVYDPNAGRSFVGEVFEGTFRFLSGRKNARSSATVGTPVGTIGIRGTALDGVVGENAAEIFAREPGVSDGVRSDKKTATLAVLRGPGASTLGGLTVGVADVTAAGKTVTLDQPAYAAYIPRPGAQPIGPFRLSAAGLSRLQDLTQPSVARAGGGGNGALGAALIGAAVVGAAILLTDGDDDGNDGQNPSGSGNRSPGSGSRTPGPTSGQTTGPAPTPSPSPSSYPGIKVN